jgi:hypothetical protein
MADQIRIFVSHHYRSEEDILSVRLVLGPGAADLEERSNALLARALSKVVNRQRNDVWRDISSSQLLHQFRSAKLLEVDG